MRRALGEENNLHNNLFIFSAYFQESSISQSLIVYIKFIGNICSKIIFITNDDRILDKKSTDWLVANKCEILYVKNEGYDFGMWRKAIVCRNDFTDYNAIYLANDSCFCFASLKDYAYWFYHADCEAASMLISFEQRKHMQSYFMSFKGGAIESVIIFFKKNKFEFMSYDEVVKNGELGLSFFLEENLIKIKSYIPIPLNEPLNPAYYSIGFLLDNGLPLIKKKFLIYLERPSGYMLKELEKRGLACSRKFYLDKIKDSLTKEDGYFEMKHLGLRPIKWGVRLLIFSRYIKYKILRKISIYPRLS